jgi:hypothetical protein
VEKRKRFKVVLEKAPDSEACGITIPFDVKEAWGALRVPVRGTINGFPFRSTVVRMAGCFLMAVNQGLRAGANAKAGDVIDVVMEPDEEPRAVTPPDDVARAIGKSKAARAGWEAASYTRRKELILAVEDAKKPETRARRIQKAVAELAAKPKK